MAAVASPSPGSSSFDESSRLSNSGAAGHFQQQPVQNKWTESQQAWLGGQEQEELPDPICGGCGQIIDENCADEGVIQFATHLWHVDCFRCAKCKGRVRTDRDDILLLSDGHPICGQCNYTCQMCGGAIMEEAIMTGDESYHASCFNCRSCHSRIEELVFAKTSQGIYCMACHNERVARSRRNAEHKRAKAKREKEMLGLNAARDGEQSRLTPTEGPSRSRSPGPNSPVSNSQTNGWSPHFNGNEPQLTPTKSSAARNVAEEAQPISPSESFANGRIDPSRSEDWRPRASHESSQAPEVPHKDWSKAGPTSSPVATQSNSASSLSTLPTSSSLGPWLPGSSPNASIRPGSAGVGAKRPMQAPPPPTREIRHSPTPAAVNNLDVRNGSNVLITGRGNSEDNGRLPAASGTPSLTSSETAPANLNRHSQATSISAESERPRRSASFDKPSDTRVLSPEMIMRRGQASPQPSRSTSPARPAAASGSREPVGLGIDGHRLAAPGSAPAVVVNFGGDDEIVLGSSFKEGAGLANRDPSPASLKTSSNVAPNHSSHGSDASHESEAERASNLAKGSSRPPIENGAGTGFTKSSPKAAVATKTTLASAGSTRFSKAFSFYDPDFINLMDSFGRFDSDDDFKLNSTLGAQLAAGPSSPSRRRVSMKPLSPVQPRALANVVESRESEGLTSNGQHQAIASGDDDDKRDDEKEELVDEKGESASLDLLSAKMRASMQTARDGHVSMDTSFVETILHDLDETRDRMKELQVKYDRIKRASQQAAQGFSMAREEYENEVHARHEAELEMTRLKRQLAEQAFKLTSITSEKRQHEQMQRKSQDLKSSLKGMEQDLSKLRIERDLTVAEVAELVAMQDGSSPLPREAEVNGRAAESTLAHNLGLRLDGVKSKYRKEIDELTQERDALLIEIEELKQSREVFQEEAQSLNAKNDELSAILNQLTRSVEMASQSQGALSALPGRGNSKEASRPAGFGFGFGKPSRNIGSPSMPSYQESGYPADSVDTVLQKIAKPEKIEMAPVTKKFKWMKPKLSDASKVSAHSTHGPAQGAPNPPVPPKVSGAVTQAPPVQQRNASHDVVVREHLFQPFNILRPTRCMACQKNMWGQSEVRCALCAQVCHSKCLQSLPVSCNQPYSRPDEPLEPQGPSMFGKDLTQQAVLESRDVPVIVEKCIQAVEAFGMDYEGIYRKSGGSSQLKVITQLFERGMPFDLEDSDRFNDVSAITSVLKNYFRELPTPLLTYDLHEEFIKAAEMKGDPKLKAGRMGELIGQLPKEHYQTLKCLIQHLNRVQQRCEENRMNSRNLGVVFGPTLMKSGDPSQEFAHMGGKAMTIEYFIEHADQLFTA
ncbi:RhoGAP-domain-containing protein [Violaceomyces palustris]|uniref:RhoGAP-domain-containing protein n=1 Tax=Violaceomyces palustris TaxID=1673888 RepID=A0ACD0NRX1_9BASI|nr:RhoGAP-domain-containing protein [Violaceomyces palustris]